MRGGGAAPTGLTGIIGAPIGGTAIGPIGLTPAKHTTTSLLTVANHKNKPDTAV